VHDARIRKRQRRFSDRDLDANISEVVDKWSVAKLITRELLAQKPLAHVNLRDSATLGSTYRQNTRGAS
jgi:hypothetical protein